MSNYIDTGQWRAGALPDQTFFNRNGAMMDRKPEPTWMYKRGVFGRTERRLFEHPDDVPEGWYDSPAHIPELEEKPKKKKGKKDAA